MSRWKMSLGALLILLVALGTRARTADQTLVAAGSTWKYNDSGSNLGTAWRAVTYNDASWLSGPAQLGYGDGDESTVLSYGPDAANKRITYYFRRAFTVASPASIAALKVRHVRDDGCVIYLNGVEVVRSNMPTGTVSYTTRATTAIGGADESAWLEASIDPALLVTGTNVVAVEIHQQAPSSSDVSFNLELIATEAVVPGPSVGLTAPANHAVSNNSSVTFNATVAAPSGLASATLFVGGPPQTAVFSGPLQMEDAQMTADTPTLANGSAVSLKVDGLTPHAHSVIKFPSLVGSGGGRVPPGATIASAVLQVNCTNAGNVMRLYRVTQSWVEDQATWNERSTGVPWGSPGADGAASNAGVPLNGDCTVAGQRVFDITSFVQEWSNGTPNHGLVLIESGTDGVDFSSSESGSGPVLTVTYKSTQQPMETKLLSGTSATVTFLASLPIAQTYYWNVRLTDATGGQAFAPSDFDVTIDAASPDAPVLVSPADGSSGVATSPSLAGIVSDPGGGTLNVSVGLRQATAPDFTIIAVPDTQHYSEQYPAIFTSQTQWIVDNKDARNIVFVTHEGDIVQNNSVASEWVRANTSMSLLDGVVPYGMGPGNHDLPTTLFNQYFPYTRYQGLPWYGGHEGTLNDNNYELFTAGGMDFVIVHLTFCPPAAAVTWADSVLKTYPNRVGIFTTHGYLGLNAVRNVHVCGDTQFLWDGLAVPNPNLRFMLSGHVHGEARRIDSPNGQPVFQMLADYQDLPNGGNGWLRILRFVPAEGKVYVQTYSPWLNQYQTDADSEFTLDFPMGGAFAAAGSAIAASGTTASIPVSGLTPNTQYEWQMTVTNGSGKSRSGPVWRFTTGSGGPINQPPVAGNQSVAATEDTSAPVTLGASDPDGNPLTYSVVSGPSHGALSGTAPALTYQPAANYSGADSFTFRVNDGQVNSNTATVSIAIQAVNDAPAATADSYNAQAGGTLTVNAPGVLANDTDVDSAALTPQLVTGPTHGTLTLNANGSFTYTPAAGYSGPDAFTYAASDGQIVSASATVNLVVAADTTPPTRSNGQPTGTLAAGTTQATLSLATNEPAACRYATTAGVAYGSMTNTFGTTGGISHSTAVTGLANGGSYSYYVRCQDASDNPNTTDFAITFSVAVPADTTVPIVTMTTPTAGTVSGNVTVSADASDNVGVVGVQFLLNGSPLGAEDTTAPYSITWNSTSVANGGPYQLSARVRDAATNQATATAVSVTVSNATTSLIAAYSFNEGSGATLVDRSGRGHTGTISGATWSTSGKYGSALSFDGVNDWVTVNDTAALDLTTGMTLEAWVNPAAITSWRTVLLKERSGGLAYALYGANGASRAAGYVNIGGDIGINGTANLALNTWTHLAVTYDAAMLRIFVNGVQVATQAQTGAMTTSTGALRIGGNSVWSEFFQGRIDEIRIHNRALTQAEIQADMAAPITP